MAEQALHEEVSATEGYDIFYRVFIDDYSFTANHWHQDIEIIYVLEGSIYVSLSGMEHKLEKGDFFLINSKIVHSTKNISGNKLMLLQIPYPFLKKYIKHMDSIQFNISKPSLIHSHNEKIEQFRHTLEELSTFYENPKTGSQLRFQSLLFDALYQLRTEFSVDISKANMDKHTKNLDRLLPILDYTREHYKESITIHQIASLAILQPEYFCRFFKKNMGTTYLEYLNEVRLSHIYHDLLTTDYSLNYLLSIHGFTNYKLFRRMFLEHFGGTPSQIRKKSLD